MHKEPVKMLGIPNTTRITIISPKPDPRKQLWIHTFDQQRHRSKPFIFCFSELEIGRLFGGEAWEGRGDYDNGAECDNPYSNLRRWQRWQRLLCKRQQGLGERSAAADDESWQHMAVPWMLLYVKEQGVGGFPHRTFALGRLRWIPLQSVWNNLKHLLWLRKAYVTPA